MYNCPCVRDGSRLEELKRRCNEVKDFCDDLNVKLVRPFGDMLAAWGISPASKRYSNDYIQYVTQRFPLLVFGFGATQMLGETGGYLYRVQPDTGRNVYSKLSALASQGKRLRH